MSHPAFRAAALACCATFLPALLPGPAHAATARKPNIVLIFLDDVNYAGIGPAGGKFGPTPNIDALAAGGAVCREAYVTAPLCSPSRAGLVTGRYQQRFGHELNGKQKSAEEGLPTEEKTFGDRLRALGYRTACFGKWHLGHGAEFAQYHPLERGFDEFYGFMGSMVHFFRSDALWDGRQRAKEPRYLTDVIAARTSDFIRRHKAAPFFVYAAFNFIHTPLEARKDDLARFAEAEPKTRAKLAMTLAMDRAVGEILETLRAEGLDEQTLVILTNDNGDYQGNGAFRGGKGTINEGGIRVPFFVRWKGQIPEGQHLDGLVSTLDILPTAVAAAGGSTPADWKLDGVNLLPYLRGEVRGSPHEALYWRMAEAKAVRKGNWKLTFEGRSGFGAGNAVGPGVKWKLFDLGKDPAEATDLSEANAGIVGEFRAAYAAWEAGLAAPRWPVGASGEMGKWSDAECPPDALEGSDAGN